MQAAQLKTLRLFAFATCVVGAACSAPKDVAKASNPDSSLDGLPDTPRVVEEGGKVQRNVASPIPQLICSPKTLQIGDTVTLRMPTPHGGYLAVINPEGAFYFVVDPLVDSRPVHYSFVRSEDFKNMATLRLPTSVRAPARVYGRDSTLESVFGKAGEYEIRVGENLESDYATPPSNCKVSVSARD